MYYKSEIKAREIYFKRCMFLINYMTSLQTQNKIQQNQNYYILLNHIHKEFIDKNNQSKDFYLEKKDIHENYVLFLSLFPTIDDERRSQIETNLLSDEEYREVIEKIKYLDKRLDDYKKIFKDKKPLIDKKTIRDNIGFNYFIEEVVDSIYRIKVPKNAVQSKK